MENKCENNSAGEFLVTREIFDSLVLNVDSKTEVKMETEAG